MAERVQLSVLEQEFCRSYALDNTDPIGLWRDVFDPTETMTLEQWGQGFIELSSRPEIEAEVYAQQRIVEVFGYARLQLVAELEQARVKALEEPNGAGIAHEISMEKGRLLDLLHSTPRLLTYAELLAAPVNKPLLLN